MPKEMTHSGISVCPRTSWSGSILMSSENLDLVRSIYAALDRGDYSSADWADPDIEFVIIDGPAPGSWSGVAQMAQAWRDILSAWDGYRSETEEYRDLGGGHVLVLVRAVAGRG